MLVNHGYRPRNTAFALHARPSSSGQPQCALTRLKRSRQQFKQIASGSPSPLSNCQSSSDDSKLQTVQDANKRELWWAAAKLPMYSVGFIPVLVGAAAAFAATGSVSSLRCMGFVVGSILVIAWLNLSNDAFDATTGVDNTKPESVVNLTGSREAVLFASKALLACGVALLSFLIYSTGDWRISAMLTVSIVCGYIYQGPPFRLSYQGLGEPLCFLAFGPMATPAFYLALLPTPVTADLMAISPLVWSVSVIVGITTTAILFCSHWHQIEGDKANNKQSPLVRLGSTERALPILTGLLVTPYVVAIGAGLNHLVTWGLVAVLCLSLPLAWQTWGYAMANYNSVEKITPLKRYAVKWHTAVGLLLCIALAGGV